jgi:hypothetical protein
VYIDNPRSIVLAVSVGSAVLILSLIAAWWIAFVHTPRRDMNDPPSRGRRLQALLEHEQARERFPHRIMELTLRRRPLTPGKVLATLKQIAPGTVIRVHYCGDLAEPSVAPIKVPFEPVELDGLEKTLQTLVDASLSNKNQSHTKDSCPFQWSEAGTHAFRWLLLAYPLVLIGIGAYGAISGSGVLNSFGIGVPGLILLALNLAPKQRWWAIPGGFVTRRIAFASYSTRLSVLRAPESVLLEMPMGVMGFRGIQVVSSNGGKGGWLRWRHTSQAMLSAWFCEVPSPTDEVIRTFFGIESKDHP